MKLIKGSVTSPAGFLASAVSCGIKRSGREDLALIYSENPCNVAGVFTTNRIKSGSVILSMERVKKGVSQAVIVNSGNANCCVGERELKDAKEITSELAKELKIDPEHVLFCSTGIIGRPLPVEKIKKAIPILLGKLSNRNGHRFAKAIMTTDTVQKEIAIEIDILGHTVILAGTVKGAGMIHPKMATMLAFFTTDASIENSCLRSAFKEAVQYSFNRISVDGDMSTNDTALIFANGMAGNPLIKEGSPSYRIFSKALRFVAEELAKKIVLDGEGATKFIEVNIKGARTEKEAEVIARRIANSNLVKTMIAGGDPNWGRIAAAAGSSGARIDQKKMDIYFDRIIVMKNGRGIERNRKELIDIFRNKEINITVDLKSGRNVFRIWTCDLTSEYVKINAEYET